MVTWPNPCATQAIRLFAIAVATQAAEPGAPGPGNPDLDMDLLMPTSKGCAFSCPTGAGEAAASNRASSDFDRENLERLKLV